MGWQDTENRDTVFLTIEGQALDPRPAAASTGNESMNPAKSASKRASRKDKVAHIRFTPEEFAAVIEAAERAEMTVSAFVRSLSLEGAGVHPFMNEADRAILQLLSDDIRAVGSSLNQVARAINTRQAVAATDLMAVIDDARAIATTVAAEFSAMTRRAGGLRRGEVA